MRRLVNAPSRIVVLIALLGMLGEPSAFGEQEEGP